MNPTARTIRRWLTAFPDAADVRDRQMLRDPQLFRDQRRRLTLAMLLVRGVYVCMFFILLAEAPHWHWWSNLQTLQPLWPVEWFRLTGIGAGVTIVLAFAMTATLAAAAMPHVRVFRAAAAIGGLEFGAFFNSFGSIGNGLHGVLWAMFLFVLLPDGTFDHVVASRRRTQRYLRVFWAAQFAVLLFYTMSGLFKFVGLAMQLRAGEVHALAPEALARQIAARLLVGVADANYMLGPFFIAHPYVGWPLFLGAIYLEACSLLVAFRPAVQRAWAIGLILMHVGIYLTMTIMFSWQVLLLGVILLCSPQAPTRVTPAEFVRQLPLVGDAIALTRRVRRRGTRRTSVIAALDDLVLDDEPALLAGVPRE